jgi:hypothetical protein
MRVIVGLLLLLGVVLIAKGVLAVARGHGMHFWGDDGVLLWRRLPRGGSV